jgi:hypothetical protein
MAPIRVRRVEEVPDTELDVKLSCDIEDVGETLAICELIAHVEAAQRTSGSALVVSIGGRLRNAFVNPPFDAPGG